jgi:hypothetical protein
MRWLILAPAILWACRQRPPEPRIPTADELNRRTPEEVALQSRGCFSCHEDIDDPDMHQGVRAIGCADCHGGDPAVVRAKEVAPGSPEYATLMRRAHVLPRDPARWPTSANPNGPYTLTIDEDPAFVRFVNPSDLRVAHLSCGPCHAKEVDTVRKSIMTTSSMLWGAALYNNGVISKKKSIFGESYGPDGAARRIQGVAEYDAEGRKTRIRRPTDEELRRGVLEAIDPLPRWNISQPGNILRAFEAGGEVARANPGEVGSPNPFEDTGKPDAKLGARGLGTEARIEGVVLGLQKIRLNDPHLSFIGPNSHAGDYRTSGCAACHVVYANDRSPVTAGPYAKFGDRGASHSVDPTIPKNRPGHPIRHQFTRSIPTSQCLTCHHHQANGFLNSFTGCTIWDYESDGETMWPASSKRLSAEERWKIGQANPEGAALRGNWSDPEFLAAISEKNPNIGSTHGHGWLFRKVYKRDRQGRLLDAEGRVVPEDAPDKLARAVHLMDIHLERGMHCVDCHTRQDVHGDGRLYGEMANAVEIACVDCHGTVSRRFGGDEGEQTTSGPASAPGPTKLTDLKTPWGQPRFEWNGPDDPPVQRSMVEPDRKWNIPQVRDSLDPKNKRYNPRAALSKTIQRDGKTWGTTDCPEDLAHSYQNMECYSCHNSWTPSCYGCHFPVYANEFRPNNHYEGGNTRGWSPYNFQVVREDTFGLGHHGSAKGGKIATMRSASAAMVSVQSGAREWIVSQQATVSAAGYSGQAHSPHFAHTVRKTETRGCADCHLSREGDNNAWMAQVLLQGTGYVNFIGKFAYVGGEGRIEAVRVSESEDPQAVIGSNLHRLAYPDEYRRFEREGRKLNDSVGRGAGAVTSLQWRGEYLYTTQGPDGFRVYDIANIDNKGVSEKFVTAPVSPLGQDTHVSALDAAWVALPTNAPIHYRNDLLPASFWKENEEIPMHPLYKYAYVADRREGLIVIDVMPLADGNPSNNFLRRGATWNPQGALDGARHVAIAGSLAFISASKGLVIASLDPDPLKPSVVAVLSEVRGPRAAAVVFRYVFVADEEGLKVVDITEPAKARVKASVAIPEAQDLVLGRHYAYVAAGSRGLAIVDVERPERPGAPDYFTGVGDARRVVLGMTSTSLFAYVADGRHGLRVLQLTSPRTTPGTLGFSPRPVPELIATYATSTPAIGLSRGLERDRVVDETGNQIGVFSRLGSRALSLQEQRRMYLRGGEVWTVDGSPPGPPLPFK